MTKIFIVVGEKVIQKTVSKMVERYCVYTGKPKMEEVYKSSYFLESNPEIEVVWNYAENMLIHGALEDQPLFGIRILLFEEDDCYEVDFHIADTERERYKKITGREPTLWYYMTDDE